MRTEDGRLAAVGNGVPPERRIRAHFRSDAARLDGAPAAADDLVVTGTIAQSVYIGQGYRYRVRAGEADIWVHAPERVAEGTTARVVVPRAALLLF